MALVDTDLQNELDTQMAASVGAPYAVISAPAKAGLWLALGRAIKRWCQGDGALPGGYDAANPQPVGAAAPGSSKLWSHSDHIHAHDDQAGGTLHDIATPIVSGFLSAADKAILDALGPTTFLPDSHGELYDDNEGGAPVTLTTTLANTWYTVGSLLNVGEESGAPYVVGTSGNPSYMTVGADGGGVYKASLSVSGIRGVANDLFRFAIGINGSKSHLVCGQSSGSYINVQTSGLITLAPGDTIEVLHKSALAAKTFLLETITLSIVRVHDSYGELYDDNEGGARPTITCVAGLTWYTMGSLLNVGEESGAPRVVGTSGTPSYMTIGVDGAGRYKVALSVSVEANGVADPQWRFAIGVNSARSHLSTVNYVASAVRTGATSGLLTLAAGDTVEVLYQCQNAGSSVYVETVDLSLVRVSDSYGELYDDTSPPAIMTILANTWYTVGNILKIGEQTGPGYVVGTIGNPSYMTIGVDGAGVYKASLSVSGVRKTVNDAWRFAIGINGSKSHLVSVHWAGSGRNSFLTSGLITLAAGDTVEVLYKSATAARGFNIENIAISLVSIPLRSAGGGLHFSTDIPEPVAVVGAVGVSPDLSRSDHEHAHDDHLGGTLHAVATGAVAGFESAADKTKLDSIVFSANLPEDVTETPSLVGVDTEYSRSDHSHYHGLLWGGGLHDVVTVLLNGFMSAADKVKLNGLIAPVFSAVNPALIAAASVVGVGTDFSRNDHVHGGQRAFSVVNPSFIAAASSVGASNDLSRRDHVHGGQRAFSVVNPSFIAAASSVGASNDLSRRDHVHGGQRLFSGGVPVGVATTGTAGVAVTLSHSDHRHAHSNLVGGTLHDLANAVSHGFMSNLDKIRLAIMHIPGYATIYDDNFGSASRNITATLANTWYPVNGLSIGPYFISSLYTRGYVGTTYSYITVGTEGEGEYKVSLSVSGDQAEQANNWVWTVMLNGSPTRIKAVSYIDAYRSLSCQGILSLVDDDELSVYCQCDSAGKIFQIFNIALTATRCDD